MNQQDMQRHQAEQQQRLIEAAAAMDRLAADRRHRTGTEPPRWQEREPQRPANRWRMVA